MSDMSQVFSVQGERERLSCYRGRKKKIQQNLATSKLNNVVQIATFTVNCVVLSTTHLVRARRPPDWGGEGRVEYM